jgi:beta-lactamase superfamily II metal-dependent hydrolase
MGIEFEFLKAGNGDCILISTDNTNILIDGGLSYTYSRELEKRFKKLKDDKKLLDLVILTHYDDDHIGGILKLLENEKKSIDKYGKTFLKEFWFNSFDEFLLNPPTNSNKTSAKQQIKFDEYMKEFIPLIKCTSLLSIDSISEKFIGEHKEVKVKFLSPNNEKLYELDKKYKKDIKNYQTSSLSNDHNVSIEELSERSFEKDTSLTNGASIAFVLKYKLRNFLFLADAHMDLIVDSLKNMGYSKKNRLKLEFVKLSHHGSSKNLNSNFLDLIETNRFVILANGGRHNHPHKETIAKILTHHKREKNKDGIFKNDIEFICNYEEIKNILTPLEKKDYKAIFITRGVYK